MTSVLLMLLLPVIIRAQRVSPVPSCPASCAVCSEDAVICQRLAHIIDAPGSTQALLLTEGSISTVQPASLSDLSNVTVIGLSHNHISELSREAFRHLPFLHTLLLDHNLLTGQALQGGALTDLTQLEVLALGHNHISMIQAGWFKGTGALRSLKLEGNLLTSLDSGSLPLNDLRELESLDLSDNLIDHLDTNSFRGLVSLRTLDLSRNRLSSAPAEAFSYLSWLTSLNLDLNSWNCSCQLLELATFLSTFIQQPDKTLYNGRRMVCVSADNPAVTTVLELTDANCVPSNQNITVLVETRGSVTPQLYARDLAIAAVVCFMGGVGLTLLVVLIYHQVSRRKKLKESQRLKLEEEGRSAVANHHVNHLDVSERRRDVFLQVNSGRPWSKDAMAMEGRTDGHGDEFRSRAEEDGGYLRCPHCSTDGPRLNPMRGDNRTNGGMEAEDDRERRRVRMMMMEEERRRAGIQQGVFNRDAPTNFLSHRNTNSSSHPHREGFGQRTETLPPYRTGRDVDDLRTDAETKSRGPESLLCENCHGTYRPPEQSSRQTRFHSNPRDSALCDGLTPHHRLNGRGKNGDFHMDTMKTTELRREPRNVTFALESPRILQQGNRGGEEGRAATPRGKERGRERKHKGQSSRVLKVKLNLNPLRKSKIHPRRKNEQSQSEKSSSKKSKEKRRDGGEGEEKEGRGQSGRKTKSSSERKKKSSKTEGCPEGGEEEDGGRASSKKETSPSTSGAGGEERSGSDRPPDPSAPAAGHSSQGLQYQGAGWPVGGAQLSAQLPFSFTAADRNRTTNLSLLGSAGSQLPGSSLSLQGGGLMLNSLALGSKAPLPSGPANPIAPSLAFSGPNMAPSGAPDSIGRQTAVMISAPSLPANTVHANPSQAAPPHPSQAGRPPLNSAAAGNPAAVQPPSQSQLPPDSSPRSQTVEGPRPLPSGPQAPSTTETLPVPGVWGQDDTALRLPQNLEPVENMSNNNSQTETGRGPGGSSVSAVGVALSEGAAVGGSGDGVQAAGESGSGVSSTAAALLQQEYLSEEGGSSPRRRLRLVLPEKTSGRAPTALERKIR